MYGRSEMTGEVAASWSALAIPTVSGTAAIRSQGSHRFGDVGANSHPNADRAP